MDKLDDRHERFCCEYIIDQNAMQAAIRAGYSARAAGVTGCRLLKNAKVRARVDELLREMKTARIADATEVMEYLTAVMRGEELDEKVIIDAMGEAAKVRTRVQRNQLKAGELLAKRYGLLAPDTVIHNNNVMFVDDLGGGEDANAEPEHTP